MDTISYPDELDNKYYLKTIKANKNVVLDGFCFGPYDELFKQGRLDLVNNFKLIYTCDNWLDIYYHSNKCSGYHVPDTLILTLIEKKYNEFCIPLGCLIIAVKFRRELHKMAPDGKGFDLIFNKKAYFNYLELNKS